MRPAMPIAAHPLSKIFWKSPRQGRRFPALSYRGGDQLVGALAQVAEDPEGVGGQLDAPIRPPETLIHFVQARREGRAESAIGLPLTTRRLRDFTRS